MSRCPRAALRLAVATVLTSLCVTPVPSTAAAATVNDGVIAYVRAANTAGGYVIRSVDPETGADRWLAQGTSPAWSPNGRRLAFVRLSDSGVGAIRIRNADGSVTATGVPADPGPEDQEVAWSPDGTRLAYVYQDRIRVSNVTRPHRPRVLSQHAAGLPSWSPDGRRIAYTAFDADGDRDIHVVRADGTGHVNVTRDLTDCEYGADWSPDGTAFAYFGACGEQGIYVSDVDGSNETIVASTFRLVSPSWSPTGRLAFVGDPGDVCWLNFDNTGGCAPPGPSPALQLDWQPRIVN